MAPASEQGITLAIKMRREAWHSRPFFIGPALQTSDDPIDAAMIVVAMEVCESLPIAGEHGSNRGRLDLDNE